MSVTDIKSWRDRHGSAGGRAGGAFRLGESSLGEEAVGREAQRRGQVVGQGAAKSRHIGRGGHLRLRSHADPRRVRPRPAAAPAGCRSRPRRPGHPRAVHEALRAGRRDLAADAVRPAGGAGLPRLVRRGGGRRRRGGRGGSGRSGPALCPSLDRGAPGCGPPPRPGQHDARATARPHRPPVGLRPADRHPLGDRRRPLRRHHRRRHVLGPGEAAGRAALGQGERRRPAQELRLLRQLLRRRPARRGRQPRGGEPRRPPRRRWPACRAGPSATSTWRPAS